MNKVAIAYFTKDRTELTRRTVEPLLQPNKFDLWWFDGSGADKGIVLPSRYRTYGDGMHIEGDVRGGPDRAVVYALHTLLNHRNPVTSEQYDYIGLVENDVLLHQDWFEPTMALFECGYADGLVVGAVSARAYEDRVLCGRDGYAVMHNLGWGQQIMTREAVRLTLANIRTSFTTENRRVFSVLSGVDIGSFWAFGTNDHWITPDWGNDKILAAHGLASLALTPSLVEMIGQDPPLAEQGLKIVSKDLNPSDPAVFDVFRERTARMVEGRLAPAGVGRRFYGDDGTELVFAHFMRDLSGLKADGWRHKWTPSFGGFSWKGEKDASLQFEALGPFSMIISGDKLEGQVEVVDHRSGYMVRPTVRPIGTGMVRAVVPSGPVFRTVSLKVLRGEVVFYGCQFQTPQPWVPCTLDYDALPEV